MKLTKKTLLVSLAVALPVLVGGYFGAKKIAWPRYKQYRAERFERSAREFLEKGDFENAMLFVRKNLATNPRSASNWRLAAEIEEKRDPASSSLFFYRRRLLEFEPTLDNRLRLARVLLRLGDGGAAADTLSQAGVEARDSAEFHELAAQANLRAGNPAQAKLHLLSLCELRPDNRAARLDLAQLRLAEATADTRDGLRSELRALANDPALRTRALIVLLGDTIRADASREAAELIAQLRREAAVTVPQLIILTDAIRRFDAEALPAALAQLRNAATAPDDILRTAEYLISIGRAAEARTWLASLAPDMAGRTPVQFAQAATLQALREWEAMEAFLKKIEWPNYDFERLALVAYAQRARGDLPAFGETWRLALTKAGTNTVILRHLLQRTVMWDWPEQRHEVLWRLFQQNPLDQAVQKALFARARAEGDTAGLNRIFGRIAEASPGNASAKNNFAYTCLLLGTNLPRATTLSQEIHASDPKNPYFATTRALALLRAGRADQARALLAGFDAFQLWQADRAVISAAVLLADGAEAEAAQIVAGVNPAGLLPEEKRLLDETRATLERRRTEAARTTQIEQTVAAHRDTTAARSVFPLLPEPLRAQPTLAMELADSLYARDDFAALAKELGGATWENREFLRLALLAYAQRKLDRSADSRATWRLAINAAGTRTELHRALAALARAWSWEEERMDLLARVLQREPADQAALDEVSDYYLQLRRTSDLARVFGAALGATNPPAATRARFAYYSLLVGARTSEAHVAAKAAFDQAPADRFVIRALALSLWRQGQARAGLQILGEASTRDSASGDLALVFALLREAAGERETARSLLAAFAVDSALPEEKALADDLAKRLAKTE